MSQTEKQRLERVVGAHMKKYNVIYYEGLAGDERIDVCGVRSRDDKPVSMTFYAVSPTWHPDIYQRDVIKMSVAARLVRKVSPEMRINLVYVCPVPGRTKRVKRW